MTASNRTGQRVGRYELGEALGRGGMAEVYRATDASLGRAVAVKLILPHFAGEADFRERFLREARLVAALDHPHILPVYDFGEQEGVAFLVMPLLEGGSLAERMAGQTFPLAQVVDWAGQLGGALDAAHAEGILHRDVKPSNVLVGRDGRLALADFGIAKSVAASTHLTTTGAVVGTPAYMAPELARGEPASPASDLYALAVLVWELLAGEPPFRGDSALAVLHRHVSEPVPRLSRKVPAVPAAIDAVLGRALAKAPAERPASCAAFAAELAWAAGIAPARPAVAPVSGARVAVGPTVPTPVAGQIAAKGESPRGGRRTAIWGGAVLLLLAGIVGGYLWLRGAPVEPRGDGPGAVQSGPGSPEQRASAIDATGTSPARRPAPGGVAASSPQPSTIPGATGIAGVTEVAGAGGASSPPGPDGAGLSPREAPAGTGAEGAAVSGVARGLAAAKRIGERAAGVLRPTRRLAELDFRDLLDALAAAPVSPKGGAEPLSPVALEAFARGGLAWIAGDATTAGRELDRASGLAGASATPMANPVLVLRSDALDGAATWQLAFAFGDPRGDARSLLEQARAVGAASLAQSEFGAAVLDRWEGRHGAAAQRALAALETHGATLAAAERGQLAQLAAEELAMAGDVAGAAKAFDRALAESPGQRGALAFEAAMVLGTRLGRRDLAARFFETACAAGLERACPEAPAGGERRAAPFGRRRPRPGAPGG